MIAPAERSQDLVADCPGIGGHGIDAVLVAQQLDMTTRPHDRRVDGGNVEDCEIHRNPTEQRNTRAADAARPAMAQRAQPPIRVSDRHRRQTACRGRDVRRTVANRLTGVNLADLQDFLR